jgi:hypothetical protein
VAWESLGALGGVGESWATCGRGHAPRGDRQEVGGNPDLGVPPVGKEKKRKGEGRGAAAGWAGLPSGWPSWLLSPFF